MTIDRPTTVPPEWAESLLRLLLSPHDRDSVSGDLLEEYRESIVPALGAGANRWYVRQVAGYVLRQTWMWGGLVACILKARFLYDIVVPIQYTPHVIATRSAVMSNALIASFAMCAAWQAWRTGQIRTGVLSALVSAWIAGPLAIMGTIVFLAIRHDPATMAAIDGSGGIDELWGIPLLLLPLIAIVTGTAGAVVGKLFFWSAQRLGIKQGA